MWNEDISPLTSTFEKKVCQGCEVLGASNLSGEYFLPAYWKSNKYLGDRTFSWLQSLPATELDNQQALKMMYDFHYPLGRGKLNEDTANCRAKQSGMMGKNAGSASLSLSRLSLSLCAAKKEALLRWWGCDLPLLPTSLPTGVH